MSKLLFLRVDLFAGAALAVLFSACQVPRETPSPTRFERDADTKLPTRAYDVDHYAIDLVLHPASRSIESVCRIRFLPTGDYLREIELDLVGLDVHAVTDAAGDSLEFEHDGSILLVKFAVPLDSSELAEITVVYGGQPVTGLWFSGERPGGTIPTQVFSQGQAEHNRGWFPCFDHPSDRATSEVRVTMPPNWISIAPGERIDVVESGDSRTEHWRMSTPHPSYLVSLVAGEFVVTESEWDGIPLQFIVEPQYSDWVEASFHETDEILTFLSDYTSIRYPYSKYAQTCVDNFPWGGMENISATTLTPLTLGDERSTRDTQSTGLVAHEAAHQWFCDLFTCKDWAHIWLNEGFATYLTLLYFESTRGVDEFRVLMRDAQEAYLLEDRGDARRPTVTSDWKDPEDMMDTRAYQGAAARLHLLRFVLGDQTFQAGVRTYASENRGRSVVTDDLKRAMEKVSGRDLEGFFDQWFYGRGYPEFDVDWKWNESKEIVTLTVRQTQSSVDGTPSVFRVPVDVEIRDEGGTVTHRIELTRRGESFDFRTEGQPYFVRFDSNGWIPKRVTTAKRASELLAIAHEDEDVNGRRDAIRALGILVREGRKQRRSDSVETLVAELADRLEQDASSHVRAEAATALGVALGIEARERLLRAARTDDEARVRVAALGALAQFSPTPELAAFGREMFAAGYSWATMGAAAGLVAAADSTSAYSWLTEKLFIDSPHDTLRGTLLEHLGKLESDGVDEQLRRWAVDDSSHPTARAAALRELGKRRRQIVKNSRFISDFLDAPNFRLRRAAVEALTELGDDNARRTLRAYYPAARTSGERRAIEAALLGRP